MKNFKKLKIWQKGMELVSLTYKLAGELLKHGQFGLQSQIARAAVSIPSSIAEGSAKASIDEEQKMLQSFIQVVKKG